MAYTVEKPQCPHCGQTIAGGIDAWIPSAEEVLALRLLARAVGNIGTTVRLIEWLPSALRDGGEFRLLDGRRVVVAL